MKKETIKKRHHLLGRFRDSDKTEKFVFETRSGVIELTLINNKKGVAVFCLPTHYYCNLGCKFCHLTEEGDAKKEMKLISVDDLFYVLKDVLNLLKIKDKKILLSFMGVGEPFLNIKLIFGIYSKLKYPYNSKGVALSTMMFDTKPMHAIMEEIKKTKIPLKIHFSLHSPIDSKRKKIIPGSRATIENCLNVLAQYKDFILKNNKILRNLSHFHSLKESPTEIHYTVIEKINDSEEELNRIIEYGKKYKIPIKLLKFNPTKSLKRSKKERYWFRRLLREYSAPVFFYKPPGPNIGSSCGQFTKHYYLNTETEKSLKEFKKWKAKYEVKK